MNANPYQTKQFLITVPTGKRLIAKAVVEMPNVKTALEQNTIAIISGTTNGYIAEELLKTIGQLGDFTKDTFYRGVTVGPGRKLESRKEGYVGKDIVIEKGTWIKDKTIFDIAPELTQGDIILKGANAVNIDRKQAGILVGNPTLGTSGPILQAVVGRRVELILPVGLEKRVTGDIVELASRVNAPSCSGTRLLPMSGTIITELDAIEILSGATAELIAAGGVLGAEGSCWIAVTGTEDQLEVVTAMIKSIAEESNFIG